MFDLINFNENILSRIYVITQQIKVNSKGGFRPPLFARGGGAYTLRQIYSALMDGKI